MSIILKNKIFNKMLKNGVKTHPEKILKNSIKKIQKKTKKKYLEVFKKSLINVSPVLSIKQIKRRKKQVKEFPYILKKKLRLFFGLKFILSSLKKKKNSFYNEFSEEILLTSQFKGNAIKMKKDLYEKSFQKKKYANFRWF
jgi:small subunit ribosomal protein S7